MYSERPVKPLRFHTSILLATLSSALLGCAPYISAHFLPEAQFGYRSAHSTLTTDEPIWILERGDATFYLSARKAHAGETIFTLAIEPLHLPDETNWSAKVREEARAAVKPITVSLKHIQSGATVSFLGTTARAELVRAMSGTHGADKRQRIEDFYSDIQLSVDQYLQLNVVLSDADYSEFLVEWPTVIINQKPVVLPPIKFEWKHGIKVQFING
jgi:hypothetical protein